MSKKARSEGNRIACLIKANKGDFYVADVDLEDDYADVKACVESVSKTLGKTKCSFMLISAGIKNLTVMTVTSDSGIFSAKSWLENSLNAVVSDPSKLDFEVDNLSAFITLELDTPFKLKDVVRSSAFSYLRSTGKLMEEDSDEEFYGFE
jgi:hypothetical protein